MFFADSRARKQAKKQKQEYLTRAYPPGFSNEQVRNPNPEYKLKTQEEDIYNYLLEHEWTPNEARPKATFILESLHWMLFENMDEIMQSKPLSNIIVDGHYTLRQSLEFACEDHIPHTILSMVEYLSYGNNNILMTPDEIYAMCKQA